MRASGSFRFCRCSLLQLRRLDESGFGSSVSHRPHEPEELRHDCRGKVARRSRKRRAGRRTTVGGAAGVATVNACSFSLTCDGGLLQHGAPSGPQSAAPGEVVGALADKYTLAEDSGRRETRQLRKTKKTGSPDLVSSRVLAMRRRCREAANRTSGEPLQAGSSGVRRGVGEGTE